MLSFKPTTPDSRRLSTSTPRTGSAGAFGSPASALLAARSPGASLRSPSPALAAIFAARSPGAGIPSPAPVPFSMPGAARVAGESPIDDDLSYTEKFYAEYGGEQFVEQFVSLPRQTLTTKRDIEFPAFMEKVNKDLEEYKDMAEDMEREMNTFDGKIIETRQVRDAEQEALRRYYVEESAKIDASFKETTGDLVSKKSMSAATKEHAEAKVQQLSEQLILKGMEDNIVKALLYKQGGQRKPYALDAITVVRRDLGCPYPEDIDSFSRDRVLTKLRKCNNLDLEYNKPLFRRFQEDKAFIERYGKKPEISTGKSYRVGSTHVEYTAEELRQQLKDYLCFGIIETETGLTLNDDENEDPQLQAELRAIAQQAEERMQSARTSAKKRRSSRGKMA